MQPFESQIITGDSRHALRAFPADTFQVCVSSPPFWSARSYGGAAGEIGAEPDLDDYLTSLVDVFREVKRVLRPDGTLWLNIGDVFTAGYWGGKPRQADQRRGAGRALAKRLPTPKGLKARELVGLPWRLALALQADGWWLRSDIVWHKPNPRPERLTDRPVRSHEYVFLLTKAPKRYHYDARAMREPATWTKGTRPGRSVWTMGVGTVRGRATWHHAKMPPALVARCLDAGAKPGLPVLDPFFGSGTVGEVCQERGLPFAGVELCPEYADGARERLGWTGGTLSSGSRVA